MRATNPLDCITLGRRGRIPANPGGHCPLTLQNRILGVVRDRETGELKQQFVHEGNVMATYGLNNLIERMATGGDASNLVHLGAVGTHTQAEASTNTGLYAGTNSKYLSQASMNVSDKGNLTVEYQMTIDDASAYQVHEVGLLGTNSMIDSLIARAMLGTNSINKGTADTIEISYQIIAGTG
uniref:Uncharacterized protein n=1 Tax=viral metagenome TaxID=1070528 RepID=A0A6M3IEF3_9ZZZZ